MTSASFGSRLPPPDPICAGTPCRTLVLSTIVSITLATSEGAFPDDDQRDAAGVNGRPGMQSLERRSVSSRIPSAADLSKARAAYRRRHGGARETAGTSGAALRKAENLMNEAASERSAAMRWVLLDEARKTGITAGSATVVSRAARLMGAEFDIDELSLEYRSLRDIPLRALRGERAAAIASSAESIATRAELRHGPLLAIDSLELAVRAWQAAGDENAARGAAERHDRLLANARSESRGSRLGRSWSQRPRLDDEVSGEASTADDRSVTKPR